MNINYDCLQLFEPCDKCTNKCSRLIPKVNCVLIVQLKRFWHGMAPPTKQTGVSLTTTRLVAWQPHVSLLDNHSFLSDDNTKHYRVHSDTSTSPTQIITVGESDARTAPLVYVLLRRGRDATPFVCIVDCGAGWFGVCNCFFDEFNCFKL